MSNIRFTFVLALVIALSVSFTTAHAKEEASESGTINEVTTNLRERLKEALGNEEAAAEGPRAYVGVIRDVIKNTIVVEDKDGEQSVMVGSDTEIVRSPGNSKITIDNIQIEDNVIAMGYPAEDDELLGKRLIVSVKPFSPPEKLSGLGKITDIGKYAFIIQTAVESKLEVFFTKETEYKSPSASLEFEDVSVGDQVLFTAVKDKDGDWSATVLMQFKAVPPTPSASPKI